MPAPAAYNEYVLERRFYNEFGCPSPPLEDWPLRKVADYVVIQQVLDEIEAERNKQSSAGRGGGSPDVTEQAYQAMKARQAQQAESPS